LGIRESPGVTSERRLLKILHIDPERGWGGGERQVMGLLSYLSSRGHQNDLLCDPNGPLWMEAQRKRIATFPVTVRNDLDVRAFFLLRRLIRKEKYDIVHCHTRRAQALSLWVGRTDPSLKWIVTRRMDYAVKRDWYHRHLYNQRVDGIVAISQKIADLLSEGGVRREKIRVIHSGVDPAPFQNAKAAESESPLPVVGTVAVLEERKGHRFLLEAAALLKREGYRLKYLFAGEGSQKEMLKKTAARLGLAEEVTFLGFVSDIPSFLSKVGVFVLPSLYEGLGVAVLEAMAAGKPVVATGVGGLPEVVEDRVTGLLVPPGDSGALAVAISKLISEKALMEEMGDQGWKRIQHHFTMEQMAEKNEDYYYELLQDRPDEALSEQRG
jgi:glycosyltransferase involved in cell wall biosynthesis